MLRFCHPAVQVGMCIVKDEPCFGNHIWACSISLSPHLISHMVPKFKRRLEKDVFCVLGGGGGWGGSRRFGEYLAGPLPLPKRHI